MLQELSIENLGVIESSVAEFSPGLSVLTGETGAGKTMVVSGLRLLSGERADAGKVRQGNDTATAEGIFSDVPEAVYSVLEDAGVIAEEELILARTLGAQGRSRAHAGGRSVPISVLKEVSEQLITVHGQNDQLKLLEPIQQLESLDQYAGTISQRHKYQELRAVYLGLARELEYKNSQKQALALELETLQRGLSVIEEVAPQLGEEEKLKSEISQIQNAESMREAGEKALTTIQGDDYRDYSLTGGLNDVLSFLNNEPELYKTVIPRIKELNTELADIAFEISQAINTIPDDDSVEELLFRQAQLRELKKYGSSAEDIIKWAESARERLTQIDVSDEALEELRQRKDTAHAEMMKSASALSKARAVSKKAFEEAVTQEIQGLHMSSCLEISQNVTEPGTHGIDKIEFLLNQGGHVSPLRKSASGGELSRIMLALEVILSGTGETLVFDEVDAGVGGKAAMEIGKRLAVLAQNNQVIVVTHLPQVAAFADQHLLVDKNLTSSGARSRVASLNDTQRVQELSRMLAGLESDSGRAHAEELWKTAQNFKKEEL